MRQFGSMVAALAPRRRWTRGRPRRCPQGSSPPGLVPRTSGPLAEDYIGLATRVVPMRTRSPALSLSERGRNRHEAPVAT
jgi:hypothetical protein